MRLVLPLLFGLAGCAVLVALGLWQLDRAGQKDAIIAALDARLAEAPGPLPDAPDPERDVYRAVALEGVVTGPAIATFDTWRGFGAGVRAIVPVEMAQGRRVMVDLGVVAWDPGTDPGDAAARVPPPGAALAVVGNLDWPATAPRGDAPVRDVAALAAALDAPPFLVVAREVTPETAFRPLPVSAEGIPDNHLGYAIQWFGLALVWAGMTGFLLWRMTRRTV
jgi:surfeit locus 1 family protein